MLKHNNKWLQALKACSLILIGSIIFSFAGCKSAPVMVSEVDPLDLMDNNSSFYLRIPSNVDPDLISHMLQNNLKNLSESDARRIAARIDTVYIGLNKSKKSTDYQISTLCNFPKVAISQAFSKKNGWTSDKLNLDGADGKNVEYTVYQNSGLLASFPAVTVACMGRGVPSMVETYHNLSQKISDPSKVPLNQEVKNWLSYENGIPDYQVRFFASKPQSFLSMLTGANLNFKLVYVRGILENDPKSDNQYLMQLEFEFREARMLPAAKAMLSLAFGLTDSDVQVTSDTHLCISKIKINKKQLSKILVL